MCIRDRRKTKETEINLTICLDGKGRNSIDTGIAFFDHMLDGFARHGLFDLEVEVKGCLLYTSADLGAKLLPHNMIIKLESMGKD